MSKAFRCLLSVLLFAFATTALAQSLPTSQPNILQIFREEVKIGHGADHVKVEAGWPAAFEKAQSPYTYIALVSMTGPPEAWFVSPFESHEAMADSLKREDEPTLAAELARLQKADAEHITTGRSILAMARKDSAGGRSRRRPSSGSTKSRSSACARDTSAASRRRPRPTGPRPGVAHRRPATGCTR